MPSKHVEQILRAAQHLTTDERREVLVRLRSDGMTVSQRARARAVADGRCLVCRTRDARDGRKTCGPCSDAATERNRRRRERAKQS